MGVTGDANANEKSTAMNAGMREVAYKPLGVANLEELLKKYYFCLLSPNESFN